MSQFFQSYLFAYLFWLEIAPGSFAFLMLHYLVGGAWGLAIRRPLEAATRTVWLLALLFVPVAVGARFIYPWTDPQVVAASQVLQHKSLYLNLPFFIGRAAFYFAVWIILAFWLTRWSLRPEFYHDAERRRVFQRASAIGLILYFLSMTFAAIDWIMSLQPEWFSTVFGMLVVTGQALAGLAFALLLLPYLARQGPLASFAIPDRVRDLGAFLLSVVVVWAYLAFSQYLIVWGGNLPHETTWYVTRLQGGWQWVGLFVTVAQFAFPFLVLLPPATKREPRVLAGLGLVILAARLADQFWNVAPVFHPDRLGLHWLDLALPVLIGAVWVLVFAWHLRRTPQPVLLAEYEAGVEMRHRTQAGA